MIESASLIAPQLRSCSSLVSVGGVCSMTLCGPFPSAAVMLAAVQNPIPTPPRFAQLAQIQLNNYRLTPVGS
jgi:hypothetical protein